MKVLVFKVEIHVGRTEWFQTKIALEAALKFCWCQHPRPTRGAQHYTSQGRPHEPSAYWWIFIYSFKSISFLPNSKPPPKCPPPTHTFILFIWLIVELCLFKSSKWFYKKLSLILKSVLLLNLFQNSHKALNQHHFIQSMLKWKMMLCYHKAAWIPLKQRSCSL